MAPVYIRHAQRITNAIDSDIYENDISEVIPFLLAVNIPTRIITSPYLRTRRTAEIIQRILGESGHKIDIVVDCRLSEYHKRQCNETELDIKTLNDKPPLIEHILDFRSRVLQQGQEYKEADVWIVTHGKVMKSWLELQGYESKGISPLAFIYKNSLYHAKLKRHK